MTDLSLFLALLAVAYLVPGPDMVLILQTGAAQGRRAARAAALGLAVARAAHVSLSATGLAALLALSPTAFAGLRLVGAAYLIWLGWQIWRSRMTRPAMEAVSTCSPKAAFGRGLMTNIANPKALLFCSVLLPQFVPPDQGNAPGRFCLLGAILVATGLAFDLAYAEAGTRLGLWFDRHPRARQVQNRVVAGLLVSFGLGLVLI